MPVPDHLSHAPYLSLATFRKNGEAVPTPIWVAPWEDRLYAFSAAQAGKMKRLKNSPRALIAPCTSSGQLLGVWQEVRAFRLEDPEEAALAERALLAKYGWQMQLTNLASRLSGRYHRRAYLRIVTLEDWEKERR